MLVNRTLNPLSCQDALKEGFFCSLSACPCVLNRLFLCIEVVKQICASL
eukprot:XP_001709433.1 Hypothetical protein GL50803_36990 [Giardia lamblia ATCC 50803]